MNDILPQHVAIVMDGNRRWAKSRGLPYAEGYRAGIEGVRTVIRHCLEKGVSVLSLFAFSSENWSRPQQEVEFLMQLFIDVIKQETQGLHQHNVRLQFTGNRESLSPSLRNEMLLAEQLTRENEKLVLNIVVNYGGKWDIVEAARTIASRVCSGELEKEKIDESTVADALSMRNLPDPDLFIRTSGEKRISNFFLWQLAYTELYFTDVHWPDFTPEEFESAFASFRLRERRYGKASQELDKLAHV